MTIGRQILLAVKHSFEVLLTELRQLFHPDSPVEVDAQQLVNRVIAGAVMIIAAVIRYYADQRDMRTVVANAMFATGSQMWRNSNDRPEDSRGNSRLYWFPA